MEHPAWRAFVKHKSIILQDLDVNEILDELFSKEVLNLDEYECIQSKTCRLDRNEIFLNKLPYLSAQKFSSFLNCLENKYNWLYKHLQPSNNVGSDSVSIYQDILIKGNIPRAPPHYVERKKQLQNLKDLLTKVESGGKIVVHGMTGCGKSCLVAAAVKNMILLENYFGSKVFWINLGEVKTNEQLISHMHMLLQRLIFDVKELTSKDVFYQISSTRETFSFEQDVAILKNNLSLIFTSNSHRNTLLILDNAHSVDAVNAFDVGCKVLITTQNKLIVPGSDVLFLEVKEGFTEEETLLLFSNCLKTNVNKLPSHASKIHRLCKGQPLVVSLIGSLFEQYREEFLTSQNKWQHYIKKLTEKDFTLGSSRNNKDVLFRTIKLCIRNLNPRLQDLYKSLAIFVEEVNITPKVLQTLWNLKDIYEVEEIMVQFQNKSLIVSHYSQELKTYVYGIHGLLLAYLKQKFTDEKMVELHQNFVTAYQKNCNGNFANLIDDNYIFQYLGYHLSEAQMYDMFPQTYFDLSFIGAKIKAVGIADLLKDFQLYRNYITCKESLLEKKLKDFEQFIKTKGQDLFIFKDTNIVQSALELKNTSSVYETAFKFAQENPKYLYFLLHAPQENVHFTYTLDLKDEVTATCFTNDPNQILVGTSNGDITLWEQVYGGQLCTFNGHTKPITFLQLQADGTEFLSVSKDGCVKIWKLEENTNTCKSGCSPDETGHRHSIPSPKVKQSPYTSFFNDDSIIDRSRTFKLSNTDVASPDAITSASFSSYHNNYLATGSASGKVVIWSLNTDEQIQKIVGRDQPITCVTFSDDDKLLLFSYDSNILLYDALNWQFISQFCNEYVVKRLLTVPEVDNKLIVLSDHAIAMWTWHGLEKGVVVNPAHTIVYTNNDVTLLCGAVTDDGSFLVVGCSDSYIRMWHILTGNMVKEFSNKGKATCLDVFFRDDSTSDIILLSASSDNTIKQWHLNPVIEPSEKAKLLPIFDVFWNTSTLPRVAAVTTENRIHVFNGQNLILESEKFRSPIKKVCFSLCGNKITYGLENGDVIELEIKTKTYRKIMCLHGSVNYLKYFEENFLNGFSCMRNKDCPGPKSGTLVAAAQNGWFSIFRSNNPICLVQPPSPSDLKQVPMFPIVSCFYVTEAQKLLSVAENRTVKAWNLNDGSYVVLIGEKASQEGDPHSNVVTMACLSFDQTLLAITMSDNTFDIYTMNVMNGTFIQPEYKQGARLETGLTCCCFSYDASLLALGHNDGLITIWSVELKEALYTLNVHKRNIYDLKFSPPPMFVLISAADQIIWWDLLKVPKELYLGESKRKKRKLLKIYNDLLSKSKSIYAGPWQDKVGRPEVPHLLSSIKVGGLYAPSLSANHDFTAFSTIDSYGYFYIMNLLT